MSDSCWRRRDRDCPRTDSFLQGVPEERQVGCRHRCEPFGSQQHRTQKWLQLCVQMCGSGSGNGGTPRTGSARLPRPPPVTRLQPENQPETCIEGWAWQFKMAEGPSPPRLRTKRQVRTSSSSSCCTPPLCLKKQHNIDLQLTAQTYRFCIYK